MYFGSVKFFRHLIIIVFLIVFLCPMVLAITFGVKLGAANNTLEAVNTLLSEEQPGAAPAADAEPAASAAQPDAQPDEQPEPTVIPADASPEPEQDAVPATIVVGNDAVTRQELDLLQQQVDQLAKTNEDMAATNEELSDYNAALEAEIDSMIAEWDSGLKADAAEYIDALNALVEGDSDPFTQLAEEKGMSPALLANLLSNGDMDIVEAYRETIRLTPETMGYTKLYPELYVTAPTQAVRESGVIYLTFDDALGKYTQELLDVLDEKGVKATFFVCPAADGSDAQLLKQIADAGHTIGVHSLSHDYSTIYQSVDAFLADFSRAAELIEQATGTAPEIFRFPGGSVNAANRLIYNSLISEMTRRGYTYYDWSAEGGDLSSLATASSVYNNVMTGAAESERAIVQLHSGVSATVDAVAALIPALEERGFRFDALSSSIAPVSFGYSPF